MKRAHFFLGLVAVLFLALVLSSDYMLARLAHAGIDAMAAVGLVLLMRAGQLSLGQAAFMGLGAYTAALLSRDFGWSPWLALAAGAAMAAAAAAPIGLITLRLRGHYLPLATLAWGIAIHVVFMASPITGAASGLDRIPSLSFWGDPLGNRTVAIMIWILVLLVAVAASRFLNSRLGRALRTLQEHEAVASTFGVNAPRLKMTAFVIAATFAGLAGALYTFQARFVSPEPFGLGASFALLIAVTLGGATHPVGAVIGALVVSALNFLLQTLFAGLIDRLGPLEPVLFGTMLIILLLRWPGGLWSALASRLRPSTPRETSDTRQPPYRTNDPTLDPAPMLELINVDKEFGGLKALHALSICVGRGRILGLIGPNGAGKSTAFNMMSGLALPTRGKVLFKGKSLPKQVHDVVRLGLARTFQHVKLVGDMTVVENVQLGAYCRGHAGALQAMSGMDWKEEQTSRSIALWALDRIGLAELAQVPATSLPLGKQRLVEIARALAASPSLLLLDEPAAGLRAAEKQELIELVRKLRTEGLTIVLVEHDVQLVMACADDLIVLDQGSVLASGLPAEVRQDRRVIEAYLGGSAKPSLEEAQSHA